MAEEDDLVDTVGYIAMNGMFIFHYSSFIFLLLIIEQPLFKVLVLPCRCPFTGTLLVSPLFRCCRSFVGSPSRCSDIAATVTENGFSVFRSGAVNITTPFL